jgi:hypothetical protein
LDIHGKVALQLQSKPSSYVVTITPGLANRSFKKPWFFGFLKKTKNQKSSNFWFFFFLIFDFNDPELVKIYSLVFLVTKYTMIGCD